MSQQPETPVKESQKRWRAGRGLSCLMLVTAAATACSSDHRILLPATTTATSWEPLWPRAAAA